MRIKTGKIESFNYKCKVEFGANEGYPQQIFIRSLSLACPMGALDSIMLELKEAARIFSDECEAADRKEVIHATVVPLIEDR